MLPEKAKVQIIRHLHAQCNVSERFQLQALLQVIASQTIREVLQSYQRSALRERKLTPEAVVWLLIAMNLYPALFFTPPSSWDWRWRR